MTPVLMGVWGHIWAVGPKLKVTQLRVVEMPQYPDFEPGYDRIVFYKLLGPNGFAAWAHGVPGVEGSRDPALLTLYGGGSNFHCGLEDGHTFLVSESFGFIYTKVGSP